MKSTVKRWRRDREEKGEMEKNGEEWGIGSYPMRGAGKDWGNLSKDKEEWGTLVFVYLGGNLQKSLYHPVTRGNVDDLICSFI